MAKKPSTQIARQEQQITLRDEKRGEEEEGDFLPGQDAAKLQAGDLLVVEDPGARADGDEIGQRVVAAKRRRHQREKSGMAEKKGRCEYPLDVNDGQKPGEMNRVVDARSRLSPQPAQLHGDKNP